MLDNLQHKLLPVNGVYFTSKTVDNEQSYLYDCNVHLMN